MKVILTMLYNRLCRTGVAAHRHPYWMHRRGWCGSKRVGLRQQHLMAEIVYLVKKKAQHVYLERSHYKPHVPIDEGPASVKLLIVRQQQLHVGLQQQADLLLGSPLTLFLFLFVLLLLAEDGVQILSDWKAHHQVCKDRSTFRHISQEQTAHVCYFFHTDHCLSVGIPEAVQIVAVGGVHAILHNTCQFPLPSPGEISL